MSVSLSVLDDLFLQLFQFHFLQPSVSISAVVRAKGVLNKPRIKSEKLHPSGIPSNKAFYTAFPLPAYLKLTPQSKM